MSSGIVSIYVTFASADEAERIGRTVIEERLAACINILGEAKSIYRWQGRIEEANEQAAILKTSASCAELLSKRIAELHSYANPAIVVWPIDAAPPAYVQWVRGQLR
jgi:periplasmic divalent cation tolerance protein